jgi:hypothetical protein
MQENKKRMEITLDNYTYKYLKEKKINASKLIRQLLRVALFSGSTGYTPYTAYTDSHRPAKLESYDYTGSNPVLCVFNQIIYK